MEVEVPSNYLSAAPPPEEISARSISNKFHGQIQRSLSLPQVTDVSLPNAKPSFPLEKHKLLSPQDSGNANSDSGVAQSGASILLRYGDEDADSGHNSSQYCPSLLLGDIGLMLGGQILLPKNKSRSDSVSETSSVKNGKGSKVQGDFASGGSHMLASEPQSSAHSEVAAVKQMVINQIDKKLKDLRTLKQHYYPEGGWGWVILLVSMSVQALVTGAQMGFGMYLIGGAGRAPINVVTQSGGSPGVTSYSTRAALLLAKRIVAGHEQDTSWLGSLSLALSLFISPLTVAVCRRKSTRLTAVMGGLIAALGCLFTSFASQFHQLFLSYGIMMGIGVGMTRDPATLMLGQYFKRKRDLVEIVLVASSGVGIAVMSVFMQISMGSIGWRLGLQAVTGIISITFFLGTFYRSASLYHPQRRAILHLKSQKRKIKNKDKEKNKAQDDKPPYFDFNTLKSRTVQILLTSIALASVGLYSPIFYLVQQAHLEGIHGSSILMLQMYLGCAWALGCCLFGAIVINHSKECQISKQYLCQASLLLAGVSILGFTAVEGYNGYVMFVWIYGVFCGGYHYTLKMYVYEKVRARNFARAWGFAQFSMSVPILFGIPITGYITNSLSSKRGFYFSAVFVLLGSIAMLLIDVHRKKLRRRRRDKKKSIISHKRGASRKSVASSSHHSVGGACNSNNNSQADNAALASLVDLQVDLNNSPSHHSHRSSHHDSERKLSFTDQDDMMPPVALLSHQRSFTYDDILDVKNAPELSLYSEEGIADMDLPDHLFMEDFECLDNITSCNKVENCVMLSEYEQNLIKETESPTHAARRAGLRKWSLFRQQSSVHSDASPELNATIGIGGLRQSSFSRKNKAFKDAQQSPADKQDKEGTGARSKEIPTFPSTSVWNSRLQMPSKTAGQKRSITVIEEASV